MASIGLSDQVLTLVPSLIHPTNNPTAGRNNLPAYFSRTKSAMIAAPFQPLALLAFVFHTASSEGVRAWE